MTSKIINVKTDCSGRSISIGCKVAMTDRKYTYRLVIGEVIGETPLQLRVSFGDGTTLKYGEQLCIVPPNTPLTID